MKPGLGFGDEKESMGGLGVELPEHWSSPFRSPGAQAKVVGLCWDRKRK